jgi:RNA polymerase subunit RPABC4/transcription elongation factor Spt4
MRTLCSGCGGAVGVDFMACPHCGQRLNAGCGKCSRPLQPGWAFCPFCATTQSAKPSRKKLREQGRPLELPGSNVAEFKIQTR